MSSIADFKQSMHVRDMQQIAKHDYFNVLTITVFPDMNTVMSVMKTANVNQVSIH